MNSRGQLNAVYWYVLLYVLPYRPLNMNRVCFILYKDSARTAQ